MSCIVVDDCARALWSGALVFVLVAGGGLVHCVEACWLYLNCSTASSLPPSTTHNSPNKLALSLVPSYSYIIIHPLSGAKVFLPEARKPTAPPSLPLRLAPLSRDGEVARYHRRGALILIIEVLRYQAILGECKTGLYIDALLAISPIPSHRPSPLTPPGLDGSPAPLHHNQTSSHLPAML